MLGREVLREAMRYSIFFSRPPQVTLALRLRGASSPFEEYSLCICMQEKNEAARKKILGPPTVTDCEKPVPRSELRKRPSGVINSARFFHSLTSECSS